MGLVREDEQGLYVINNGAKRRPGDVAGYAHFRDMSDGGLKKGDKVKLYHVSQTPMCKLVKDDGTELYWSEIPDHMREYTGIF